MRRKTLYYVGMLLFAAAVFITQPVSYDTAPKDGATRSSVNRGQNEESRYYLRFTLSRHPAGSINCYVPKYGQTDETTVRLYASFFNMPENLRNEETDAFTYTDENGTLTVYKSLRQLTYTPRPWRNADLGAANLTGGAPIGDREAIARAAAFMEEHMLYMAYEEARVFTNEDTYTVTFIDRIGNIKNYAFNNTVTLDRHGRVLQADYFFIQYERLGACKIKSMRDAFRALPDDLPEDTYVSLTNCELVYSYEDSIVQPVYFFEGEASGGRTFESFVKAAVYGEG